MDSETPDSQSLSVKVVDRRSPDSTTDMLPVVPLVVKKVAPKKASILSRIKGVAKSLSNLHDAKSFVKKSTVKPDSTSWKGVNLRRTGRKPIVVAGSPAKKRRSNGVDPLSGKRRRLSTPCVQLTKVTEVQATTDSQIRLRPRLK